MRRKLPFRLLAGVVLLFVCSATLVVLQDSVHDMYIRHAAQLADWPFEVQYSNKVLSVQKAFTAAGMKAGDAVQSIDGQPFTGWYGAARYIRSKAPGYELTIQVLREDRPMTFRAPMQANKRADGAVGLAVSYILQIVFPTLCAIIGLWVVYSRPQDPAAWWVCGILMFISLFFNSNESFTGPAMDVKRMLAELFQAYMQISAVWLGMTFPERLSWDRKAPWFKWAVTGLAAALLLISWVEVLLQSHWIAGFRYLPVRVLQFLDHVSLTIVIGAVSLLCAGVFHSYFATKNPDARRRMRVLLIGSQVGLWPIFILIIFGTIAGKNAGDLIPLPLFLGVLLMFMLFPLSLAYSIVVERAMDISILVRQGTRYALARGTLLALQGAFGLGLAFSIKRLTDHGVHPVSERLTVIMFALLFALLRSAGRKRASEWIDRKFFREQYSTELVLSDLVREAGRFTETKPLLDTMTRRISETLHVDQIAVLLRNGHSFQLQSTTGFTLPPGFLLADTSQAVNEMEADQLPATVYFDRPDEWLVRASETERAALREMRAEILLPLPGRQRLMGVMALGPKRSEQPYSKTDLQLLTSVGAQTGLAVENSNLIASLASEAAQRERIHREIEIAREVQERLFPQSFPQLPGVCITGHCRPALAVGGDYYDCMVMPSTDGSVRIGIAIGDISGKGISASLLMASLRASLRSQTLTGSRDVAHMMRNVNTLLYEASDTNRYATFFFAVYEPATFCLTYVNGGHNAPAVLRRDAGAPGGWRVFRLEEGGPVVGLIPGVAYTQQELQMQPGDLFLSFTDGISEAMDPEDEEWGEERLILEAEAYAHLDAEALCTHLFAAADRFAAGAPQHDDMTVVLMQLA